MFCPKCSEPKANDATIYCTKCGFDLSGMQAIVESGGLGRSKLQKGVEHGIKLLMLGVLLIPVWMFIGAAFPPNDRVVESAPSTTWGEAVAWIGMWIAFLAGAGRIAFALAFERGSHKREQPEPETISFASNASAGALPPADAAPASAFGKWKTTGELRKPALSKLRTSGNLD